MTASKPDATPDPEPVLAPPEPVEAPALPEGAKVVAKAPAGHWERLLDGDGEPVTVDGKHVLVVR